jgi:hypothetical protein
MEALRYEYTLRLNSTKGALVRWSIQVAIAQKRAQGMPPEDACYAATRELGGVEQIKEECRDMRRVNFIENFSRISVTGCASCGTIPASRSCPSLRWRSESAPTR